MLTIITISLAKAFQYDHVSTWFKIKCFFKRERINYRFYANGRILIQGSPDIRVDDVIVITDNVRLKVTDWEKSPGGNIWASIQVLTPLYEFEIERINQRTNEHAYVSEVSHHM